MRTASRFARRTAVSFEAAGSTQAATSTIRSPLASTNPWPLFGVTPDHARECKQAYYAAISFVDAQIGRVLDAMDDFCRLFERELFLVEPLFYHSALLYERHGCEYLLGRHLMESINAEFGPGGRLHRALDGSTAFRQPGFDRTIRGRSWAIHDGILGMLDGAIWSGVKMYRQVGRTASVSTFPDAAY